MVAQEVIILMPPFPKFIVRLIYSSWPSFDDDEAAFEKNGIEAKRA